jgi:hypothetical protein
MAALHVWCRLDVPAQESVDDLAKLEQITELAERRCVDHIVIAERWVGVAPVGPRSWNERSATVRQMTSTSNTPRRLMLLITASVWRSNAWPLRMTVT